MTPVIGISCYGERASWGAWNTDAVVLHRSYVDALVDAGAAVVLVPPLRNLTGIDAVLDRLDGLVIAGGADVGPASYGATPHPTTDTPRHDRDSTEAALYVGARARGLPVLGICRGLQVMAVAEGGSLEQDLPSLRLGLEHRHEPGTFTSHAATFTEGSLVARVLGTSTATVNSSHHQSVGDPGRLVITGRAADGTIEVCEDPAASFVLGVQWHPEQGVAEGTDGCLDGSLFSALVAAARLPRP